MIKPALKLLVLAWIFTAGLRAQSAGKRTGVIRFPRIQAEEITPPGSAPDLYWVITDLPRADDIEVPDEEVKQALLQLFDRLRAEPHPWHLRRGATWNLLGEFSRGPLSKFNITLNRATPYTERPRESGVATAQIEVSFVASAPTIIRQLQVEVWTAGYLQETLDRDKRRNNQPAPPAGATCDIDLGPLDSAAPVTGKALQAEVQALGTENLRKAFRRVAGTALRIAQKNGFRTGAVMDESARARTAAEITREFDVRGPGLASLRWPSPQAKIETSGEGAWSLRIRGAAVATDARIQVLPGSRFTVIGKDQAGRQEAELRRVEDRMNQKYSALLAPLRNVVPTHGLIEAVASRLDADPQVEGRAEPVAGGLQDSELLFRVTNRWVIFGFSLKGGISYSPEESATGNAEFAGDNLLRLTNEKRGLADLEDLEFKGGYDRRFTRGSVNITRQIGSCKLGLGISANYLFDRSQLYGNPSGTRLQHREASAGPQMTFEYRSPDAGRDLEPRRHHFFLQYSAGFEWRDAAVRTSQGTVLPLSSGIVFVFSTSLGGTWSYENENRDRPGLGMLTFGIRASESKGLALGEFPFNQVLVTADVAARMGFEEATDFLLRFRQGGGAGTGRVPLFQIFRLGGSETLRGIEQGEFVGRQMAFQQLEAGVSARYVAGWFRTAAGSARRSEGLDLSKLYVKGFYDRGRVLNGASAGDILGFAHAKKGYGIALEVQSLNAGTKRLSLTIGYARSPDSIRHPSGVAFTSASIRF